MGSNSFGRQFQVTTFGESHGKGIGCIIDGCPAGISIDKEMIEADLKKRRPGYSNLTSPRKEEDKVEILSGVFENLSTGTPITLWIKNKDQKSENYNEVKNIYRVGHANFSYLQKYGIFDYRGGGRASARETAARVAAGSIAKKIISPISIESRLIEAGGDKNYQDAIKRAQKENDSVGGIILCRVSNMIAGLGDPIYEKLEASLAKAMLSINACCGIAFGKGFAAARMKGSQHNDQMKDLSFLSNNHGGILAGISTGEDVIFEVAFKPTSSIKKPMQTMTLDGKNTTSQPKTNTRHDPCVALRAPPIVDAMTGIILADFLLLKNCSKI